ncbi:MAG: MOSC domain-containing protein [Kordiimonadaceae bacterium]|nr:MOSC domain-containing protein [Kordiimonadaceae bacterium]
MNRSSLPSTILEQINIGKIGQLADGTKTAIFKAPVHGSIRVSSVGLDGDMQANKKHHGGLDKAIHIYPANHYAHWQSEYPDMARAFVPGSFGENLIVSGLLEEEICIGDQITCGSVTLEVSQARQPCWVLAKKFSIKEFAKSLDKSGKTGFYCRVLVEGAMEQNQKISVVTRPNPRWDLFRTRQILFGKDKNAIALDALRELSTLPALSVPWKAHAARKLQGQAPTDENIRLYGAAAP